MSSSLEAQKYYIQLCDQSYPASKVQLITALPKQVHVDIFKYLLIKEQKNFSLTCKYAKKIIDHTLVIRAQEYGFICQIPTQKTAKEFLRTLFKVVSCLIKKKLLQKREVYYHKKSFLCLKNIPIAISNEQTLLNILNFDPKRLSELYSTQAFSRVKNINFFHFFLLKKKSFAVLGADIQDKIQRKINPLFFSAIFDANNFAVKSILKLKINPNIKNKYENSPLRLAVLKGDLEIIELLLMYGADPSIENRDGSTPLILSRRNPEITALFLMHRSIYP